MSDETGKHRQLFYALRLAELVSQASSMLNVLDCDVLDEAAIDNAKYLIISLEHFAQEILESTRKLLDP